MAWLHQCASVVSNSISFLVYNSSLLMRIKDPHLGGGGRICKQQSWINQQSVRKRKTILLERLRPSRPNLPVHKLSVDTMYSSGYWTSK